MARVGREIFRKLNAINDSLSKDQDICSVSEIHVRTSFDEISDPPAVKVLISLSVSRQIIDEYGPTAADRPP